MSYSVNILPRAIKELEFIPELHYARIVQVINDLQNQPRPYGIIKLKGREGSWRILLTIHDNTNTVTGYRVLHRKDAYK